MTMVLNDVRFAFRFFRRSPVFTLAAVLTLGLGIGANSAIFTVVDAVLLRALPFRDPDRLVVVNNVYGKDGANVTTISGPDFAHRRDENHAFEQVAAWRSIDLNLTDGGDPERVLVARVSASLFPMLGLSPVLGRPLRADDDRPEAAPVAVIARGFWLRRYGGSASVLGTAVALNGVRHVVVGVMPETLDIPDSATEVWVPMAFQPAQLADTEHGNEYLGMIARLKPGVSIDAAQADMTAVARRFVERAPADRASYLERSHWGARVTDLREERVGRIRPTLLVILGAASLVLLITCVNVANLLMARAGRRRQEMAIRVALGAGRARLVGQLLTESGLLGLAGGVAGVVLASWTLGVLVSLVPETLLRPGQVTFDLRAMGFALAVTFCTSLLFGAVPAFRLAWDDTSVTQGSLVRSAPRARFQRALIAVEVALAVMVMAGAGLMINSLTRLHAVDPGFGVDGVLTLRLSLPASRYPAPPLRGAFYGDLLERLAGLRGVVAAGATSDLPLSGVGWTRTFSPDDPLPPGTPPPGCSFRVVTPGYFAAMRIPLLRGRTFASSDAVDTPRVAIIDQALARTYWPGRDPVGRRVTVNDDQNGQPVWRTIVAVVGDVKDDGLDGPGAPHVYVPHRQYAERGMTVVLRAQGDPLALVSAARAAVTALDRDQPVYDVRPLDSVVSRSLSRVRFGTVLLSLFGALSLMLASIGLYGLMAYLTLEGRHEMAVRLALGATPSRLLARSMAQGLAMVGAGMAAGAAVVAGFGRVFSGLVYGVAPTDLFTFACVGALLAGVSMVACYLPVRRIASIDTAAILRG